MPALWLEMLMQGNDDEILDEIEALFQRPAWQAQAACKGMTDLFFPEPGQGFSGEPQTAEAKQICATCPVLAECSDAAVNERHGVWGGQTERERRRARDRRRRAA
jgi:WhiB family redox-sensing transcriptional regulator